MSFYLSNKVVNMPKTLSLKKAIDPPKNQKPITQFFKNTHPPATLLKQNVNAKYDSSHYSSVKRKASSFDKFEKKDFSEESCESNDTNSTDEQTISKKFKRNTPNGSQHIQLQNEVHRRINQKSPEKENFRENHLSEINNIKLSPEVPNNLNKVEITHNYETSVDRSPLTPVENVGIEEKVLNNSEISNNLHQNEYFTHNSEPKTAKKSLNENEVKSPNRKRDKCLKRSPVKVSREVLLSPRTVKLRTPEKIDDIHDNVSPSKRGSTVKVLDFSQNDVDDIFGDDWEISIEKCIEDLDLTKIQRCEITGIKHHPNKLELRLKNDKNNMATCFVEGIWLDTPLTNGETVSVLASRDSTGQFSVNNTSGLLALRPDHLVSTTSVVAGVFCRRKAVLQERWRGIDSANVAMTIGILVHELVQKALTQRIMDVTRLRSEADAIINESIQMLYDAGLTKEQAKSNIQEYVLTLAEFMQTYVANKPADQSNLITQNQKDKWNGHIDDVLDIEENICCPQLGLKGKIDATLQVTIHEQKGRQRAIVPLELKSGKASMSAEHRGQLVLYGMMLNVQRGEDPASAVQRGLLLYLRDRVDIREISCGYPERRDLIMLRNQLVQYLANGPQDIDPEQITDIEDVPRLVQQPLPEPVHHQTACAKCPYLTLCSLHLWHTNGPTVKESHPLTKLRNEALGHLNQEHIKYFLHWTALIKMEEKTQMMSSPLRALWIDSAEKRAKRGTCAANLKLKRVEPSADRYLHYFERHSISTDDEDKDSGKSGRGPEEGSYSIVSVDGRPWLAAGTVVTSNDKQLHILLERDLSRRLSKATLYHIDTYESYATTVQNLTNLGVLMDDTEQSLKLRQLIIEKCKPEFDKKLPREVGRLGVKLMRSLNIEQQRAVLKALAAKQYALLQGLPGTGKTQTISVLIQMLVALKQRVLVTAHTHSAVDTVLNRLPESMRVMRLGSKARVSPRLHSRCEEQLTAHCETPEQLHTVYNSMDVVGVTCLGATHPMLARTTFDVCIVDEATQVLQCTVLRPLFAAKCFILVGDPEQLPPVVKSRAARRLGMEESLFHRLLNEDVTTTLRLQYRMNQPLVDIANRVAYNDKLKCADQNIAQAKLAIDTKKTSQLYSIESPWLLKACSPEPQYAALFIDMKSTNVISDTDNYNKTCTNIDEVTVVLAIIDALTQGGVKSQDIGVIAPYRDQVSLMRRLLQRYAVEVSTVDQFQGRDKSVIVYSCTKRDDGNDDRKAKENEVLNDQRRLAVSVTRAKHKLLIIGNSRALRRYAPLQRLIDACTSHVLEADDSIRIYNKYKTLIVS